MQSIIALKQPEKFDQLTINKAPRECMAFWKYISPNKQSRPRAREGWLIGAGVQGSIGTTKIPYGFFKYNDPTKVIDGTGDQ